ncbi:ABC transporter substrate-binding protein [Candidatus Leptofilum sp.]|uniref:ABC transporter substrate-binding protein n=1 Tax=Candidatus Leptofilum sp. TaxID=3241576 RepID=UPI003B5C0CD2
MKTNWKYAALILLLLAALLLAACGTGGDEPTADGDETTTSDEATDSEDATTSEEKMTIILIANSWSASELNIAVAKNLLENELGYPVEVVSLDENAQWPALAAGDAHASLEVWPSGHAANVEEYIDGSGTVENGGLLGPVGRIGWYMPAYMLDQNADLATWEGFTSDEAAALFATAETGDAGQFLGGDPSFVQYDGDIINNLGMQFEVVFAGSEEAILAQLDSAYSREEPVLFYFWTPHSIHAKYELTRVELPEYSDDCYAEADSGGVDCDYPGDDLFKIFWSGLAEAAPDAHTLLTNMSYSTEDQISMIAAVEIDGQSVEEAAQAWLDANEDVWRAWLP